MALAHEPFDELLATLDAERAGRVAVLLEDVRLVLEGAKAREWPFDRAWSAAINRVQPRNSQGERLEVDEEETLELREARDLLGEDRGFFRAAYEGRRMTEREVGERRDASLARLRAAGMLGFERRLTV